MEQVVLVLVARVVSFMGRHHKACLSTHPSTPVNTALTVHRPLLEPVVVQEACIITPTTWDRVRVLVLAEGLQLLVIQVQLIYQAVRQQQRQHTTQPVQFTNKKIVAKRKKVMTVKDPHQDKEEHHLEVRHHHHLSESSIFFR